MIAGLLFLAFAFFAVAQAGTVRGGGQSAADAAALAAAREDRDAFRDGLLDALGRGAGEEDDSGADGREGAGTWQDWLAGSAPLTGDGCGQAERFAARNRSDLTGCTAVTRDGDDGYTVHVRTRFDTGDSVVPGAAHKKARARATAVVRPRCEPADDGGGDHGSGSGSSDGGHGHGRHHSLQLHCDGGDFTLDPDDTSAGPQPSDLYSVVLVE